MHKDNIFKALKGEVMFVERLWCRFGIHRWSKWSKAAKITNQSYSQQSRECSDCGRLQVKKVKGDYW